MSSYYHLTSPPPPNALVNCFVCCTRPRPFLVHILDVINVDINLSSFNINDSGVINGVFDNGIIRPLGQILLAQFANELGLVESGNGTFREGISSGVGRHLEPGDQGTGSIRAGAIELSNTDVGRNLVDLIVASTNYRGNARVISSTQQLVDELLVLGR